MLSRSATAFVLLFLVLTIAACLVEASFANLMIFPFLLAVFGPPAVWATSKPNQFAAKPKIVV